MLSKTKKKRCNLTLAVAQCSQWRGGWVAGGGWRGRQNLCKNVTTALSRRLACQCETFSQFEFNELLMVTFCCPMSPSRLIGGELFIFPHDDKQTDGTFSDISNCPQQSNNCPLPAGRKRIDGGILQVPAGVARVNIENHLWQLQKCCNDQFWSPFIFGIHKKYPNYRRLLHLIINWCLILFVTNCG